MTTAEKKLVNHRLSVLELAGIMGNVSEACQRMKMDRTSFYEPACRQTGIKDAFKHTV